MILIFIPTYNEAENVKNLYKEIKALGIEADILFMDDNSPDGTGKILDEMAKNDSGVKVIHRSGKLGIGSAHAQGIQYAYDHGYKKLLTMDCDFTHLPADIPRMLTASKDGDVVVGSRYLQDNSLPGWNPLRRFLTYFAHFLTRVCLGNHFDASGAFRVYDLQKIPMGIFQIVKSKSYSFFFESIFILTKNGFSISEIAIVLPSRTYGHSKMNALEAFKSARYLMRLTLENSLNPGRFRIGRAPDSVNEALKDEQNWAPYWERKEEAAGFFYEMVATIYRRCVIRPNLERFLIKHFPPGSKLLHAGCGSGQVDVGLHQRYSIKAVDISYPALDLYSRNNPDVWRIEQDDILKLHQKDGEFDGVYNLGVMEHFEHPQIITILKEFRRVLKGGGKIVIFWPNRRASSVFVLRALHWVFNKVLKKNIKLHPDEISLLKSQAEAVHLLKEAGFQLIDYSFSIRDFYVQSVVVGQNMKQRGPS